MEIDGSERAIWEARWNWAAGRRDADGQPRRRLIGVLGGVVAIAGRLRAVKRDLIRVWSEVNRDVLGEIMIPNEGSQMKNFSRFIAS